MALARWGKPLTLLAMCLGLFMPQLDTTVVNLALPSIQHSLNTDVGALQWIIDGYNLTFAALLLTGGTLGDLFGRKRLFLLGLLVFAGGSLLCGLASDFPILLMGRILQGHFHMRDGELLSFQLLHALVCGYREMVSLPLAYEQRIRFTGLLINVRTLARSLQKRPPGRHTKHQLEVLREDLVMLL
ncbi:MAG TPA: MFS transporter [Ktedonobacteraceae bacterium]